MRAYLLRLGVKQLPITRERNWSRLGLVVLALMLPSHGAAATEDEDRIGLTGETRANLIKAFIERCRSSLGDPTFCRCYADALADNVSVKELNEISASLNQQAAVETILRPKMETAAKRCKTNNP